MSHPKSGPDSCHVPVPEDITRRSAMRGMVGGSMAGALALSSLPITADAIWAGATESLTGDHWQQLVGSGFVAIGPLDEHQGGEAHLCLEQVIETDWRARDPNRPLQVRPKSVSLLFSADRTLSNATYAIWHRQLGKANLFLHAVPRDDFRGKYIYEILLN